MGSGVSVTKGNLRLEWYDHDIKQEVCSESHEEFDDTFDLDVRLYRVDLVKTKLKYVPNSKLYHALLLFHSNVSVYYLVEKTTSALVVQFSKELKRLQTKDAKLYRPEMKKLHIDEVREGCTIRDLYEFLKEEKEREYNLIYDNCQHFAQRGFNRFARRERCTEYSTYEKEGAIDGIETEDGV